MFKDWKTTITAIVGAAVIIIHTVFKIEVPKEVEVGFISLLIFLIGFFAKDSGT
jgi:hypothetical protein